MGAGASHELLAELQDQQQRGLVDLEGQPLDERGVELLGGVLRDARGVRRVRVGGCGLSGAGLQRMVDALCISSEPCRLRRLDLVSGWVGRGGEGGVYLFYMLCAQTTCRGVQKGNPIGDTGAKALAMVSGAWAATSLAYLYHYHFFFPPLLLPPLRSSAQLISRAPFLQHVVAAGCDIGDTGAKHIAHSLLNNGHLQVLDLG